MTDYRFEIGNEYKHKFSRERKRSVFLCTARDGDRVTLTEVGGKGRVFSGEVGRAATYDGYNECLEVGLIQLKHYNLVDHIVAHDFLEAD